MSLDRSYSKLAALMGIALHHMRYQVEHRDADDQALLCVEAGLEELGFNPDDMVLEIERTPTTHNYVDEPDSGVGDQIIDGSGLTVMESMIRLAGRLNLPSDVAAELVATIRNALVPGTVSSSTPGRQLERAVRGANVILRLADALADRLRRGDEDSSLAVSNLLAMKGMAEAMDRAEVAEAALAGAAIRAKRFQLAGLARSVVNAVHGVEMPLGVAVGGGGSDEWDDAVCAAVDVLEHALFTAPAASGVARAIEIARAIRAEDHPDLNAEDFGAIETLIRYAEAIGGETVGAYTRRAPEAE